MRKYIIAIQSAKENIDQIAKIIDQLNRTDGDDFTVKRQSSDILIISADAIINIYQLGLKTSCVFEKSKAIL